MINDNETTNHLKIKVIFDGSIIILQMMAHHVTKLRSEVAWAVWNLIRKHCSMWTDIMMSVQKCNCSIWCLGQYDQIGKNAYLPEKFGRIRLCSHCTG